MFGAHLRMKIAPYCFNQPLLSRFGIMVQARDQHIRTLHATDYGNICFKPSVSGPNSVAVALLLGKAGDARLSISEVRLAQASSSRSGRVAWEERRHGFRIKPSDIT